MALLVPFYIKNSCINEANMILYAPHDLTPYHVHIYTLTPHIVTKISIAIDDKRMGVVSSQQDESVLRIGHGISKGNGFLQL